MFDSQTLWCEAASVMSLACGERETEREREGGRAVVHPRAQHPLCYYGPTQRVAGFANVCYISMKGEGARSDEKGCGG